MSAPFPNLYTHRKVAESSAKACDICYKLSTSVLITPDKKDFFYVCPVHLKDRYFCSPKIDEDAIQARRERQLAEETDKLKKEYREKLRKKKEKEPQGKDKGKDQGGDEDTGKDTGMDTGKDESAGKDKEEDGKEENVAATVQEEEARVFELKSTFYQQRLQKKRQGEMARRDRERASHPNYFPSVPSDLPGK